MISFFQVLGGLALFLFGVRVLSRGMEKIAGHRILRTRKGRSWRSILMKARRSNAGKIEPEADTIYLELLRNLERISDHADSLSISVLRD